MTVQKKEIDGKVAAAGIPTAETPDLQALILSRESDLESGSMVRVPRVINQVVVLLGTTADNELFPQSSNGTTMVRQTILVGSKTYRVYLVDDATYDRAAL